MNALQTEVIKLIANDTITTAEMTDRLNRKGWQVRPADVLDALHRLEAQRVVERLWRRAQQGAKSSVAANATSA